MSCHSSGLEFTSHACALWRALFFSFQQQVLALGRWIYSSRGKDLPSSASGKLINHCKPWAGAVSSGTVDHPCTDVTAVVFLQDRKAPWDTQVQILDGKRAHVKWWNQPVRIFYQRWEKYEGKGVYMWKWESFLWVLLSTPLGAAWLRPSPPRQSWKGVWVHSLFPWRPRKQLTSPAHILPGSYHW